VIDDGTTFENQIVALCHAIPYAALVASL
jgi:hypothetical protein